jgi:hypothetical protein
MSFIIKKTHWWSKWDKHKVSIDVIFISTPFVLTNDGNISYSIIFPASKLN